MLAAAIRSFALVHAVAPAVEPAPAPAPEVEAQPVEPASRAYEGAVEVASEPTEEPRAQGSGVTLTPGTAADREPDEAPGPSPGTARHRLVYRNLLAARLNPLGLVDELFLGWRAQLVRKPGILWKDSFFATHAHLFVNPAYARVGPWIELQPLAIWQIAAGYDFAGYFGVLGQLASFPSPAERYDDDTLDRIDDAGGTYPTWGHVVTLFNQLQFKIGDFAVRDGVRFYWNDMKLRAGDRVWYDQAIDILMPDRGWALTNDLDALWVSKFGLVIGARYTLTHAFYEQKHFRFGEPVSQPNGPTHRVGPAAIYTFFDRPGAAFNKPSIILLSQWWVRHRWRTGEVVSTAVPYLVLAFTFEGDLWPRKKGRERRRR